MEVQIKKAYNTYFKENLTRQQICNQEKQKIRSSARHAAQTASDTTFRYYEPISIRKGMSVDQKLRQQSRNGQRSKKTLTMPYHEREFPSFREGDNSLFEPSYVD